VDDGYEQGMSIPIYYDPMLAKLVVHAPTREEAIQKLKDAIRNFKIEGVTTTLPFGTFVLEHEAFCSGHFDTHFVKNYYRPELIKKAQQAKAAMAALAALKYYLEQQQRIRPVENKSTSWKRRLAQ
jgi:propionyl-CoA carboxylase alpha chain